MQAYTDYLFTTLGDKAGIAAPVREVRVLSFDGDKYCRIEVEGTEQEVKYGYLYSLPGRNGSVPSIPVDALERLNQTGSAKPAVPRRVVCAANRFKDTGEIVTGARHFDNIMRQQLERYPEDYGSMEQGFIDQFGTFMTREEAWGVAEAAGQIIRRVGNDGKRLFSENLY